MGSLKSTKLAIEAILDNSRKARMARAADQGFDTDVFHGSSADIKGFRDGITYSSSSPETASDFAIYKGSWEGANVTPAKLRGNYLEIDADYGRETVREAEKRFARDTLGLTDADYPNGMEVYEYAKAQGYDGVKFKGMIDDPGGQNIAKPSDVYATFDPKNLRSVNATFDPAKKDSANLLASMTGAGVLGASMLGSEEAEAAVFGKPVKFIEAMLKKGQQVLYHSGDASLAEDIAKYGIEPEHGPWIREVLAGSVDDVDQFLDEVPAAAWFSENPDWVGIKASRASGIPYKDITEADIAKHGHLSIVDPKNTWDEGAEFYRIPEEGVGNGEYTEVRNLAGDPPQKLYETPLYGESMSEGGRYTEGLEPGDIVSTEGVEAITTLTGDDLVDFLRRNYPDKLKNQTTQRGNASPEMLSYLATTAAASQYFQAREKKRGFWEASKREIGEMMTMLEQSPAIQTLADYSGRALESLEMPMQGYHGMAAVGGRLLGGSSLDDALQRGATVASQPIEQTAQEYGDAAFDASGSPLAATAAYTAGVIADPF